MFQTVSQSTPDIKKNISIVYKSGQSRNTNASSALFTTVHTHTRDYNNKQQQNSFTKGIAQFKLT